MNGGNLKSLTDIEKNTIEIIEKYCLVGMLRTAGWEEVEEFVRELFIDEKIPLEEPLRITGMLRKHKDLILNQSSFKYLISAEFEKHGLQVVVTQQYNDTYKGGHYKSVIFDSADNILDVLSWTGQSPSGTVNVEIAQSHLTSFLSANSWYTFPE